MLSYIQYVRLLVKIRSFDCLGAVPVTVFSWEYWLDYCDNVGLA